jgi:hypothetical protein
MPTGDHPTFQWCPARGSRVMGPTCMCPSCTYSCMHPRHSCSAGAGALCPDRQCPGLYDALLIVFLCVVSATHSGGARCRGCSEGRDDGEALRPEHSGCCRGVSCAQDCATCNEHVFVQHCGPPVNRQHPPLPPHGGRLVWGRCGQGTTQTGTGCSLGTGAGASPQAHCALPPMRIPARGSPFSAGGTTSWKMDSRPLRRYGSSARTGGASAGSCRGQRASADMRKPPARSQG